VKVIFYPVESQEEQDIGGMQMDGSVGSVSQDNDRLNLFSKNRIENLIDAIYAFSMTLLVTAIEIPSTTNLTHSFTVDAILLQILPNLISYFSAFILLATFWWINHVRFHYIRTTDQTLIIINILSLSFVALIPFTTHLSEFFPLNFHAAIIFELNLLIIGILSVLQWEHIIRNKQLAVEHAHPKKLAEYQAKTLVFPILSVVGITLAILSIPGSIFVYLLVPLFVWVIGMWYRKS
jgi:uncharacterized membrane protein